MRPKLLLKHKLKSKPSPINGINRDEKYIWTLMQYRIAVEIQWFLLELFSPNFERGGVHLLTDFIGGVGYFMTNIGLGHIISLDFAGVTKMMIRKKNRMCMRALRNHFC